MGAAGVERGSRAPPCLAGTAARLAAALPQPLVRACPSCACLAHVRRPAPATPTPTQCLLHAARATCKQYLCVRRAAPYLTCAAPYLTCAAPYLTCAAPPSPQTLARSPLLLPCYPPPPFVQDEYRDAPGSVISADFYHSNALMPLPDDEVVARLVQHIRTCEPGFNGERMHMHMHKAQQAHHSVGFSCGRALCRQSWQPLLLTTYVWACTV